MRMRSMLISRVGGSMFLVVGLFLMVVVTPGFWDDSHEDKGGLVVTLLMGVVLAVTGIAFLRGAVTVDSRGVAIQQACYTRRFGWDVVADAEIVDESGFLPRTKVVISRRDRARRTSLWPTLRYVTPKSQTESEALLREILKYTAR
jgi:hypothetical protein